jgi:hypothetical protein
MGAHLPCPKNRYLASHVFVRPFPDPQTPQTRPSGPYPSQMPALGPVFGQTIPCHAVFGFSVPDRRSLVLTDGACDPQSFVVGNRTLHDSMEYSTMSV